MSEFIFFPVFLIFFLHSYVSLILIDTLHFPHISHFLLSYYLIDIPSILKTITYLLSYFNLFLFLLQGDIIIAEMSLKYRKNPTPLPFDNKTARDYLLFIYWKKIFDIVPLTEVDAQYILRRQKNQYDRLGNKENQKLNSFDSKSNTTEDSNKRGRASNTENENVSENTENDADSLIAAASCNEWLQINLTVQEIGKHIGTLWHGMVWYGIVLYGCHLSACMPESVFNF